MKAIWSRAASLLALSLFAVSPSLATINTDDLPTFSGQTWAMEVTNTGATEPEGPFALILTIVDRELIVLRYDVATKDQRLLYSGDVDTVTEDYEWTLSIGGNSVGLVRNSNNDLVIDSTETEMTYIPPGGWLVPVQLSACATMILSCVAWDLNPSNKALCCTCCVSTHRCVGIPSAMDGLCCFYMWGTNCVG